MSYTTVLGVAPGKRPAKLLELHNGWGWSPNIWARMTGDPLVVLSAGGQLDRLWMSIDDLPEWQQAPLVLTFDVGVIPWFAYEWAADQLDRFTELMPPPPDKVDHIPAVAELLRSRPESPFVGIWGTSVTENPFDPWDDERDERGNGLSLREFYVLARHRDQLRRELGLA